ncbi:MAG: alpha/beta fold hydrolase [Bacteriovoracaceae bacterium]
MSLKNFQTRDNETISYFDSEKGNETVLLIHGFPFSHEMWTPQIEELKKNYRVVAPDMRGMGGSSLDAQFTLEMLANDLIFMVEELELPKVHAVGFSMGGYVLLRALEKQASLFYSITLADTQTAPDSDETKIKRTDALLAIKEKGLEIFATGFLTKATTQETQNNRPILMGELKRLIGKNSSRGAIGLILAMMGRTDTEAILSKLTQKTLILVGEHDVITPVLVAQKMKEKIPHAELKIIPQAGHMSNQENEAFFNMELESFFRSV